MKFFISKLFETFYYDIKNVTTRKLKAIEQSHLDARFATPERLGNFHSTQRKRWEFQMFSQKKLQKTMKKVI